MIFHTKSPFLTGMGLSHPIENGFLWHHTLGVPYLPASSIKGMMRAWMRDWREEDRDFVVRLFGSDDANAQSAGSIIVFDALPVVTPELALEVITPHDGGWRIKKKCDAI